MTLEARHAILDTLTAVLGEEYAIAVMDHRRAKKCPLTPLSAKILAKQFGLCPDPKAAVEEMLNRGWTGFKAEWMARPKHNTGRRTLLDSVMEDIDERRSNVGNIPDAQQLCTNGSQSRPDTRHLQIGFAGPLIPSRH